MSNDSQRTTFNDVGFQDPTNGNPRAGYRGQSSINVNARGTGDSLREQNPAGGQNFTIAGTAQSFGLPESPNNAQYPHNKVIADPSGNMIELDSTPFSERMAFTHRSGTRTEVDAQGTQTNTVVGDNIRIDGRNSFHGVAGDYSVSSNGDMRLRTGVDMVVEADGSMTQKVRNDYDVEVSGSMSVHVKESLRLKGKTLYLEFDNIHILAHKEIFIRSEENTHVYTTKELKIQTVEGFNLKIAKGAKIQVGETVDWKVAGAFKVTTGNYDHKINGEGKINSTGKLSVKASQDIRLQSLNQIHAKSITNKAEPAWAGGADDAETATEAADAVDATKANDTDLPANGPAPRLDIQNRPQFNSRAIARPTRSEGIAAHRGGGGATSGGTNVNDPNGPSLPRNDNGEAHREPVGGDPINNAGANNNVDLITGSGVRNFLNTIPHRASNERYIIRRDISQENVAAFNEAARRTGYPVDMMFAISSWEAGSQLTGGATQVSNTGAIGLFQATGPYWRDIRERFGGSNLPADKAAATPSQQAEGLARYQFGILSSFTRGLGRQPTRGEMYMAHVVGYNAVIEIVKMARDPATADNPVRGLGSNDALAIKLEGANVRTRRTNREFVQMMHDRMPNGNSIFSPNPAPRNLQNADTTGVGV